MAAGGEMTTDVQELRDHWDALAPCDVAVWADTNITSLFDEIERLRATVKQQADLIKQLKEMAHIPFD